jgi:hypothetical protein
MISRIHFRGCFAKNYRSKSRQNPKNHFLNTVAGGKRRIMAGASTSAALRPDMTKMSAADLTT